MATSDEIKRKALELSKKTDSNSISPKEVGGIMHDLASLGENAIRNGGTLGIRKVYTSVSVMEADKNPKDFWGNPMKKGNLVLIYDGTTTGLDNNKIYVYMNPGWEFATYLDAGYPTRQEFSELGSKVVRDFYEEKTHTFTDTYSLLELGFVIPKGVTIIMSGDIPSVNGRTNSADTEYQSLENGTVTDRDIKYVKNKDVVGFLKIGYTTKGLLQLEEQITEVSSHGISSIDAIVGLPKYDIRKVNNPARIDKSEVSAGIFRGYEVDLTDLYTKGYKGVYFLGTEYTRDSDIVKGYILDNNGNIESNTEFKSEGSTELCYLPLTEKSSILRATYAISDNEIHFVKKWEPKCIIAKKANNTILSNVEDEILNNKLSIDELRILFNDANIDLDAIKSTLGIGTRVTDLNLVTYPARNDGSSVVSGYFRGYQVDLTEYRDKFNDVSFRGANFKIGNNVVQGIILDEEGNVESTTANILENSNSWNKLPLTNKSKTLWASYCFQTEGGEVWEPEYVEFIAESDFYTKAEIDKKLSDVINTIDIFLPKDIYAVKGKVTQLFYRGFVKAVNPYNYDIKVMCAVGKTFPRYYEVGSTVAVGDYPIKVEVRDDNRNVLAVKESTLHIIAEIPKSSSVNVLCVGASATATGHWAAELKRLVADNYNANFVGRKLGTQDSSVSLEATGGWTWSTFIKSGSKAIRFNISSSVGEVGYGDKLTHNSNTYTVLEVNLTEGVGNIRCAGASDITPPVNPSTDSGTLSSDKGTTLNFSSWNEEKYAPFYNEDSGKIDFKTYADKYCNGNIDVIVTHLGVNSVLWEGSNIDNVENSAKEFIDGYFADFPNGKIIVSAIPMPDDGTNVYANTYQSNNINRYGTLSTFMQYNYALKELTESYSNVYWAPSDIFFDTDYGYPKAEKNVNTRISQYTELIGTNGMHPVKEGSYMVADGILPIFVKMIND